MLRPGSMAPLPSGLAFQAGARAEESPKLFRLC